MYNVCKAKGCIEQCKRQMLEVFWSFKPHFRVVYPTKQPYLSTK